MTVCEWGFFVCCVRTNPRAKLKFRPIGTIFKTFAGSNNQHILLVLLLLLLHHYMLTCRFAHRHPTTDRMMCFSHASKEDVKWNWVRQTEGTQTYLNVHKLLCVSRINRSEQMFHYFWNCKIKCNLNGCSANATKSVDLGTGRHVNVIVNGRICKMYAEKCCVQPFCCTILNAVYLRCSMYAAAHDKHKRASNRKTNEIETKIEFLFVSHWLQSVTIYLHWVKSVCARCSSLTNDNSKIHPRDGLICMVFDLFA